jgi:hypothetical protein
MINQTFQAECGGGDEAERRGAGEAATDPGGGASQYADIDEKPRFHVQGSRQDGGGGEADRGGAGKAAEEAV